MTIKLPDICSSLVLDAEYYIQLFPSEIKFCDILKLLPLLFNKLHFGLSSSFAEDRVSFTRDRRGQAKKADTFVCIFVSRYLCVYLYMYLYLHLYLHLFLCGGQGQFHGGQGGQAKKADTPP